MDRGLALDGVGDWVEVPDAAALDFDDSSFSISLWFNTSSESRMAAFWKGGGGFPRYGVDFYADPTTIKCIYHTEGGETTAAVSKTGIKQGDWHHLACVWDREAETGYAYIDGQLEEAVSLSRHEGYGIVNGYDLHIGSMSNEGIPFAGKIDDVRLYDRALTDWEVGDLAQSSPAFPIVVQSASAAFTSIVGDPDASPPIPPDVGDNQRLKLTCPGFEARLNSSSNPDPGDSAIIADVHSCVNVSVGSWKTCDGPSSADEADQVDDYGGYPAPYDPPGWCDDNENHGAGDGMCDAWEAHYVCLSTSVDDHADDGDNDGYDNIEEFINGTDPCPC